MRDRLFTVYLWLAGLYVAFGISVARGDLSPIVAPDPSPIVQTKAVAKKAPKEWHLKSFGVGVRGMHGHKCEVCKRTWTHSDAVPDDPNEHLRNHTCPFCGAYPPSK